MLFSISHEWLEPFLDGAHAGRTQGAAPTPCPVVDLKIDCSLNHQLEVHARSLVRVG